MMKQPPPNNNISNSTFQQQNSVEKRRRRALFPTDGTTTNNKDDDLGHISPLNFDSNSNDEHFRRLIYDNKTTTAQQTIDDDYDIIGIVDVPLTTTTNLQTDDDDKLLSPPVNDSDTVVILSTPLQESSSPSRNHKTPHECTDNTSVVKLIRKSLLSDNIDDINSKNNSKVRTALFPELNNIASVPTKTFYPTTTTTTNNKSETNSNNNKIDDRLLVKSYFNNETKKQRLLSSSINTTKSNSYYLCNRQQSRRRRPNKRRFVIGQINAGVQHKIKKTKIIKQPKIKIDNKSSNQLLLLDDNNDSTAALINEYLEEMNKKQQPVKLIEIPASNSNNKENINRKRSYNNITTSTSLSEDQSNRKFFKSSTTITTTTSNNKKTSAIINNNMFTIESFSSSPPLLDDDDENSITSHQMDAIIDSLTVYNNEENVPLIIANNNDKNKNINISSSLDVLLSPTSQMCDMTSGLALNSPKKVKNLSEVLDKMLPPSQTAASSTNDQRNKLLFPLFTNNKNNVQQIREKRKCNINVSLIGGAPAKRFKHNNNKLAKNQMILDAGQKKFGIIQCTECKFVYHIGDPSDESIHLNYHNAGGVLKFYGWKNERIIYDSLMDGRVVQIVPGDSKVWWKKAKDVLDVVNRDLGFFDMESVYDCCQVFLYIKNKAVVGALAAEKISVAHKLISVRPDQVDLCTEEKYRTKCGVARIWVTKMNRKQGIATLLMNCMKKHFIFGHIMNNNDIAFSSPTDDGKLFAQNYFNTPNFLIYSV